MRSAALVMPEAVCFEGWEIRPLQRILLVNGEPVRIGSRAFDLLLVLVQGQGRVVSKTELFEAAWPGLVVEENNLSVQVSSLRKLLGPQAIVNVSGIGYRLAAMPRPAVEVTAVPERTPASAGPPLIGREHELQALAAQLGAVSLLNIVGTGGVGKTALARALVHGRDAEWPDGVHWIDLAAVARGSALLPVVARALGVLGGDEAGVRDDLLRSLAGLRALVVLDNCEHLLDEVGGLLLPLLQQAGGLRWLATSQQPIGLAGEVVHRLAPLDVAPADTDAAQRRACPAMALFGSLARASEVDFAHDDTALDLAVDICRALDGLPLALEMAAARVATLGLQGVHQQLNRRLSLRNGQRGAPARHHSLRDTYAWSYGLLTAAEQRLFRRLQPFQGGFSLALAQQIGVDGAVSVAGEGADEVTDLLESLIDKSLVQVMPASAGSVAPRFRMLESARDFALSELDAAGETQDVLRLHAQAVADVVAPAWDELLGSRDAAWAARYAAERANVGAALAWASRHHEAALVALLVTSCVLIDSTRDTEADAAALAVPLPLLQAAPQALRARACVELGWSYFLHGNREVSTRLIEQALDDAEAGGDIACGALAITRLIRLRRGRPGSPQDAEALWDRLMALDPGRVPLRLKLYAQSTVGRHFGQLTTLEQQRQLAQIAQQAGFDIQAAVSQTNLTDELLLQQRYDEVVQVAGEVRARSHEQIRLQAFVSYNEAHALVRLGRHDEARAAARRVLRATPGQAHMVIDLLALAAVQHKRWQDAAVMAGCSARIKQERDWHADPAEADLIDATRKTLEMVLAPAERARLFDLGATMAVQDVLALAGLD